MFRGRVLPSYVCDAAGRRRLESPEVSPAEPEVDGFEDELNPGRDSVADEMVGTCRHFLGGRPGGICKAELSAHRDNRHD